MEILYLDQALLVCIKPAGALSTDEPGGMPELARAALGDPQAEIRTVHRLDQVVGGLMVLARSYDAAAELSRQIREGVFEKKYLAVLHGIPPKESDTLRDLLFRDKRERKTYVVTQTAKGVQEAILDYRMLATAEGLSRVAIRLHTGRTHQIRAQFSSRGLPLVGDRKYGVPEDNCPIALWSYQLAFRHPQTRKPMAFCADPPAAYPWTVV